MARQRVHGTCHAANLDRYVVFLPRTGPAALGVAPERGTRAVLEADRGRGRGRMRTMRKTNRRRSVKL